MIRKPALTLVISMRLTVSTAFAQDIKVNVNGTSLAFNEVKLVVEEVSTPSYPCKEFRSY